MEKYVPKKHYLIGLAVSFFVVLIAFINPSFLDTLELKLLDLRFSIRGAQDHDDIVKIVAIDDASLSKVGKWPWKRHILAKLVDKLSAAGAKVIAFDIYFQKDDPNNIDEGSVKFAESAKKAGNVVAAYYFNLNSAEIIEPDKADIAVLKKFKFPKIENLEKSGEYQIIKGYNFFIPYQQLNDACFGIGHVNSIPDRDGITRKEIFAISYQDDLYPSIALKSVQKYYEDKQNALEIIGGKGINVGAKIIPIEPISMEGATIWGAKYINYRGGYKEFKYLSAIDVLEERFPSGTFKDKIVLVGATSAGLGDLIATPYAQPFAGVEKHANTIDNIIQGDFVETSIYNDLLTVILCLIIGIIFTFILPRLNLAGQISSVLILTLLWFIVSIFIFSKSSSWLNIIYPMMSLWFVSLTMIVLSYVQIKKAHVATIEENYENIKTLGLNYQNKGLLELAYENFIKLPMDNKDTLRLLYNIAGESHRKRKTNFAIEIYKKIYEHDENFEDVESKLSNLGIKTIKSAAKKESKDKTISKFIEDETLGQVDNKDLTIIQPGQTLGRYEIVKVLGKGGMGIVYLAKDPTLEREVALKTFNLTSYVDASKLVEFKAAFLQEAKLSANLNHPNIVTIFDAGDDIDLVYIAMEVLVGVELKNFCSPQTLLPVAQVIKIMITLAQALDFAHENKIIHRDIKPPNIMIVEKKTIKITDFGIAMTKGQNVRAAGTPAYMSPEQITGKEVDGRTDLYALGIILFELLTGDKPFKGSNLNDLKNKILTQPVPDFPKIPEVLKPIIKRLLEKNKQNRYHSIDLYLTENSVAGAGNIKIPNEHSLVFDLQKAAKIL